MQEGNGVIAVGHGLFQHQRDEIRAQDSQDAAEGRADQALHADLLDPDLENHHGDAGDNAHARSHRALQIEGMEKVGGKGQHSDKKKPDDQQVAHELVVPHPGGHGTLRLLRDRV